MFNNFSLNILKQKLPDNFNDELYLELNPDVKKAGIDPGEHFLKYGKKEGRQWFLQDCCCPVYASAQAARLE